MIRRIIISVILIFRAAHAQIDVTPYLSYSADSTGRGDSNNLTNRIIINWVTVNSCPSKVEFGTTVSYGTTYYNSTSTKYHHVQLPVDLPNVAKYYYRVTSTTPADTVESYFYSPNSTAEPQTDYRDFTFCLVGNSNAVPDTFSAIWGEIVQDDPEFVLHLGDMVDAGDIGDWQEQYFDIIGTASDTIPVIPIMGDDDKSAVRDSLFKKSTPRMWTDGVDWLTEVQGDSIWGKWWVFNYGPVRFIGWNTGTPYGYSSTSRSSPSQAQWSFLTNLMALNPLPYTVVLCHNPPYASGGGLSDIGVRDTIATVAEKFDSHVIFSAHNPYYQRSSVDASNPYLPEDNEKVCYVISGGGGQPLTETPTTDSSYVEAIQNKHHFITATVTDDSIYFEVKNSKGSVLDHFSVYPNFYVGRPFLTIYSDPDASMRVNWRTSKKGRSRVCFGTSDGVYSDSVEIADSVRVHAVDLTGLTPNTKYYYKVFSFNHYSRQDTFWTAKWRGDNSEFQALWIGDFQFPCHHNLPMNIQLIDSIVAVEEIENKRRFSFWGTTGDLFGMYIDNNIYTWAETRIWGPLAGHFPIMDARGNMDYFEASYKTLLPYSRPLVDAATYRFNWQNFRFISFDPIDVYSMWHEDWRYGTDQWDWLKSQMDSAMTNGEKVVLFSHITPFHWSSYPTWWSSADTMYSHVGTLIEQYGHCLWLYGHTHTNAMVQRERALELATTRGQSGGWERIVFNSGTNKTINIYRNTWNGTRDDLAGSTPGFRASYYGRIKSAQKSNEK